MRAPQTDPVDRTRFPIREWGIAETRYDTTGLGARETIFAVGNGYLGLRGNHEEGDSDAYAHGTFVNGFHETWRIRHAEEAFAFAKTGQTIVNVPDAKTINLSVDGETLQLSTAKLESFQRSLDFRDGILHRDLIWITTSGKRVAVQSTRMVSFTRRNLAVMTFNVTVLDDNADVVINSEVRNRQDESPDPHSRVVGFDPRKAASFENRVLLSQLQYEEQGRMCFAYRTAQSGLGLAVCVDHEVFTANTVSVESRLNSDLGRRTYRVRAEAGQPILVVKWVAYTDGPATADPADLTDLCQLTLDDARVVGRDVLLEEQREWLDSYWVNADVQLVGNPALQQAVRWCLFELAQATGRAEGRGIGVKGVTGAGYEGHYFWDTEVYLVPYLAHTNPFLARRTLRFRIAMLDAARRRALALSQRGALFPWRTINGEEASAYYAAGTAQYHIDADIAFAMCKYSDVCADEHFLLTEALPVLVETARLWLDMGFFRGPERSFHIHSVTGPDEYSAVVNNNLYTNLMARMNLMRAAQAVLTLAETDPGRHLEVTHQLGITENEVTGWQEAATAMTIPYHADFGVHPQDEDFLKREVWDLANTPREKLPLLLHYHPLVIYRFQVLKQADAILALFLAGDSFTPGEKRADYEYYEPITTGDSTLSAVVQSIIAAEVGYQDRALESFMEGAFVDLADLHYNTGDGVHIASAGGVWNALVYGFGGLRDYGGVITFDPRLPEGWTTLRFAFQLQGSRVRAELTTDRLVLTLEDGPGGIVTVRGQQIEVAGPDPVLIPLFGQGLRLPTLTGFVPLIHGRPATHDELTVGLPSDAVE
ncbi:glycosyl hydrolase family 65 protein [Propionicimonas sp.]|uniref:glycoside hydrolase family 65 protein n=1 Tax=Propionicimonas sp. TaxID=1955623 RepID=UPI001830857C|nr:glycosyl hydrolase family 65 protein [Propionicimonas sp.]MBU3977925.1 glycoside hydrolase family 65 protein [Actinomycetota bacterium]MBA3021852.1 glycoside hydrolase family 65 protein [Propionicimonas sp.]MBU3985369.1 glycoside hydrolase family 65 protein [Actinomycetota bacterium]MBU4007424.1 glycoside hydrolase family 65 protein [Actinomycetota bacterium]MBU4065630.1 glycoside hydrolase family 65 protein [Actinomycetota bacterium]